MKTQVLILINTKHKEIKEDVAHVWAAAYTYDNLYDHKNQSFW